MMWHPLLAVPNVSSVAQQGESWAPSDPQSMQFMKWAHHHTTTRLGGVLLAPPFLVIGTAACAVYQAGP